MQLWYEVADAEKIAAIAKGFPRQLFGSGFLYTNRDQQRHVYAWLFQSLLTGRTRTILRVVRNDVRA